MRRMGATCGHARPQAFLSDGESMKANTSEPTSRTLPENSWHNGSVLLDAQWRWPLWWSSGWFYRGSGIVSAPGDRPSRGQGRSPRHPNGAVARYMRLVRPMSVGPAEKTVACLRSRRSSNTRCSDTSALSAFFIASATGSGGAAEPTSEVDTEATQPGGVDSS